jgi:DnaJ-class molecular chaperone
MKLSSFLLRDMYGFYFILDVDPLVTTETIVRAFKQKAQQNHPDKEGSQEEFIRLREAYECLKWDECRQRYDTETLGDPEKHHRNRLPCQDRFVDDNGQQDRLEWTQDCVRSTAEMIENGFWFDIKYRSARKLEWAKEKGKRIRQREERDKQMKQMMDQHKHLSRMRHDKYYRWTQEPYLLLHDGRQRIENCPASSAVYIVMFVIMAYYLYRRLQRRFRGTKHHLR